jgi:hypothetical protein
MSPGLAAMAFPRALLTWLRSIVTATGGTERLRPA